MGGTVKGVFEISGNSRYDDAITERYHFPSNYLSIARELVSDWIVYRETRVAGGRMAYIAAAFVERIDADPSDPSHFYARVRDYLEFDQPVPYRDGSGRFAEQFLRDAQDEGLDYARENIDAWWPHVEQGVEAIVMTASGCGVMVKEYGHLLAHDARYAQKAKRISALTKDATEVLDAERSALVSRLAPRAVPQRIAFHSPCTLQHGMQIRGVAEALLAAAGYALAPVPDAHLCCGSAGTYSILQPALSKKLLADKVAALQSGTPQRIATANIGCLAHIQSGTALPVRHWVELIDERMTSQTPSPLAGEGQG